MPPNWIRFRKKTVILNVVGVSRLGVYWWDSCVVMLFIRLFE